MSRTPIYQPTIRCPYCGGETPVRSEAEIWDTHECVHCHKNVVPAVVLPLSAEEDTTSPLFDFAIKAFAYPVAAIAILLQLPIILFCHFFCNKRQPEKLLDGITNATGHFAIHFVLALLAAPLVAVGFYALSIGAVLWAVGGLGFAAMLIVVLCML